jgi:hypothetical protein
VTVGKRRAGRSRCEDLHVPDTYRSPINSWEAGY